MAEVGIVLKLFETSQRFPLRMNLRRPNALPLLGFRYLIPCGDIRQLPPPYGKQPFWAQEPSRHCSRCFVSTKTAAMSVIPACET